MQLLTAFVLNVIATSLIASAAIAIIGALFAAAYIPRLLPETARGSSFRNRVLYSFFPLVAFSLLGFVVGHVTGDSREAAVGAVVPAILTMLAGAAAYFIGASGIRLQGIVTALLACFTVALLAGMTFGSRVRIEFTSELEQPERLRQRDLLLEQNRRAVDLQRLLYYADVLKIKQGLAAAEGLDLSKFESAFEKAKERKADNAAD